MARASLAARARQINRAMRMLRQNQSSHVILRALMKEGGISLRQAYRYLFLAQGRSEPLAVPEPKAIFTVNLPRRLIQQTRNRCRQQGQPISQLVAAALQEWLDPTHGSG